jgi:DNA-binding CsgD family transcriptional regulator
MSVARHPRVCEVCQITFYVRTYRLKQNPRFCSATCMGLEKRQPKEMRDCALCGTPFEVRKRKQERENRIYCSRTCHWHVVAKEKAQKTLDRFWDRLERCSHDGDLPCPYCCWPWKDATSIHGYGKLTYNGKDARAHRRAWEIWNERTMPPELDGAHWCHVRRCCNPMHIHAATPQENYGDSIRDGRHIFGSRSGASKLTEADIPEIFRLRAMGWTYKKIAAAYSLHETTIKYALKGKSWKNVQIHEAFQLPTTRGKRLHPDTPEVAMVYALWLSHKTTRQIAGEVGLSQATVWRYIHIAQRVPVTLPDFTIVHSRASKVPQVDRLKIYERDRGICHICHRKVSIKTFTLDHLIPRSDGGPDTEPNQAIAHPRCNSQRFMGRLIPAQLRLF